MSTELRLAPRWWAWFRARVGGYFWSSCLRCGFMHGGHEVVVEDRPQYYRLDEIERARTILCPRCERQRADERHAEYLSIFSPTPARDFGSGAVDEMDPDPTGSAQRGGPPTDVPRTVGHHHI